MVLTNRAPTKIQPMPNDYLDPLTREDAAKDSGNGLQKVPLKAITMGINTIMQAKELSCWPGENGHKGPGSGKCGRSENKQRKFPPIYLQQHPNTTFVLDTAAAFQ